MFAKSKEPQNIKMETVIGPDTRFQGNIRSKGYVRVDGAVEGGIHAEGVIIGAGAEVTGDITGKTVFVGGKVTGNVTATAALELQPKGQIYGDLRAAQLSIADGAIFEGNCVMASDKVKSVNIEDVLKTAAQAS
jgi:cytoskeletal protein CcmA (bactofilin family)